MEPEPYFFLGGYIFYHSNFHCPSLILNEILICRLTIALDMWPRLCFPFPNYMIVTFHFFTQCTLIGQLTALVNIFTWPAVPKLGSKVFQNFLILLCQSRQWWSLLFLGYFTSGVKISCFLLFTFTHKCLLYGKLIW